MKVLKYLVLVVIIGLGVLYYTNPAMVKPILAELSQLTDKLTAQSDMGKKGSAFKAEVINTFEIDPAISNKEAYAVSSRVKNMYREISNKMIKRDKEIRKRLLYVQDKSPEDINALMAELEPKYENERKKLVKYCENGSTNCLVQVNLTRNTVEGSDVKMNVDYILDAQSKAFFNEVSYVNKVEDKWYETALISMNEKRYYPKIGKFQDREQADMMQNDNAKRVDISHILEGNSSEWNVKF